MQKNNSATGRFVSSVLRGRNRNPERIVIVTHLVPGADAFLQALHVEIPIACIIPKPNSVDTGVKELLKKQFCVLEYTRDQIKSQKNDFLDDLMRCVGSSSFAVIDTGGYFSSILEETKRYFGDQFVGVVEDTENGHQKYEAFLAERKFPCPVLSVARSELKDPEDFLVGQAIVFSAEALLRKQRHILTGKRALVLGYGKIGKSIAQNLHSKSARVDVIDIDPSRQILALAHGFHTGPVEQLLGNADMIFCATGNYSLRRSYVDLIKRDAHVFTATSADDEIEDHLELMKGSISLANGMISLIETRTGRFFLCNNGNSVNFVHGGIVGEFIRLVQVELAYAISQLSDAYKTDKICELTKAEKTLIADSWLDSYARS